VLLQKIALYDVRREGKKNMKPSDASKQTSTLLFNFIPSPTLDLPYIFSDFTKKRNSKPQPFCAFKFKFRKLEFRSIE
jgi:hypothetical protein